MKIIRTLLFVLLLTATIACRENSGNESMVMDVAEMEAPVAKATTVTDPERKLIKNGRVEFETRNIEETHKNIVAAASRYQGYISSDEAYNYPGRNSNTIVVRIPANKFDSFLNDATAGVKKFDSKQINVKDVTEEFLDVEARLKTKKELEVRYLELLKKANNVSEMLEIERQIGQLRSDIESVEGRLKYLQNQVAMATLTITFYTVMPTQTAFGDKFGDGFKNGWDNLIWFFVGLTNIWPFILIAVVLIILFRRYRKKKKVKAGT